MVDTAVEHPGTARPAEALTAGIRRPDVRTLQRRQQGLLSADLHRGARRGDAHIERFAVDDRGSGESLEMQFDVVPVGELSADRGQHRRGSTGVHRRPVEALAQQIGRRRDAVDVVGENLYAVAELGQFVEERQAVAAASGVDHRPSDAETFDVTQHRQDRGDADPGSDESHTLPG